MSENDFYELQGNKYRGSRYSNFTSSTATPQGDIPNAASNENTVSNAIVQGGDITPAPSAGLLSSVGGGTNEQTPKMPSTGASLAAGALPFAGNTIGQAAGQAIAGGASLSQGLTSGLSSLANKVSFGNFGTAAPSATNSALAAMGGKAGPATQSAVNAASTSKLGSAANLGGAAGAGVGTFAATLLMGGDFKDAAKSGAGAAVGTAIGSAFGPVGGFIGGTIGSLFCFAKGTPVLMGDGTQKMVEDIVLGDEVLEGGIVMGTGQAYCDNMFEYMGYMLNGDHAIFEDGRWMRVEQSEFSKPVEIANGYEIIYPLATQNHLVITPRFIAADILEIEDTEQGYTEAERIDVLNSLTERNATLALIEKEVCRLG